MAGTGAGSSQPLYTFATNLGPVLSPRAETRTPAEGIAHVSNKCPLPGYFVFNNPARTSVVGVHFRPGGALPFLGVPPGELADRHADLELLWGRSAATELRERLCAATTSTERFAVLESALRSRLRARVGLVFLARRSGVAGRLCPRQCRRSRHCHEVCGLPCTGNLDVGVGHLVRSASVPT